MDSRLQFHKSKIGISIILVIVILLSLSACTFNLKSVGDKSLGELTLPLKEFSEKYLYKNIPTPITANVYALTTTTDKKYQHYSFTFENFTLQEAKDYIVELENSIIRKQEVYEVNYDNDYPILNYLGWIDDRNSISLSQCNNSGGITINIKKSSDN